MWANVVGLLAFAFFLQLVTAQVTPLQSWGKNDNGNLGDGSTTLRATPVNVLTGALTGKNITAIQTGLYATIVLTTDGLAFGFGDNSVNQLADGTSTQRTSPVAVSLGSARIASLSFTEKHAAGITTTGNLIVWYD
jgi:alpha-tubulin suppressor-like RCC1 family protein